MSRRANPTTTLSLALLCFSCGSVPSQQSTANLTGASSGAEANGAVSSSEPVDETSAMLSDMVAPRICSQMRGSFVGLPSAGGHTGIESGLNPSAGRWWIRSCESRAHDGVLDLRIGGPGWTWVDRESSGFRIRQYLRIDSSVSFSTRMQIGYDRVRRIATVWMRPVEGSVVANVEPRGLVRAEATNVLTGVVGGLMSLTGNAPSDLARRAVAEEGTRALQTQFGEGMTVTVQIDQNQMDFMMGALDRGVVPVHPFADESAVVWSVNQRASVWPTGIDVVGPIRNDTSGQASTEITLALEEGAPLKVDAMCADDFARYYDEQLQGAPAREPGGQRLTILNRVMPPTPAVADGVTVLRTSLSCPYLLLISHEGTSTMRSSYRVRVAQRQGVVTSASSSALNESNVTIAGSSDATHTAAGPRALSLALSDLNISTTIAGSAWDALGGEPDPYVLLTSVAGGQTLLRSEVQVDRHEVASIGRTPTVIYRDQFPLRLMVMDEDVSQDDVIGSVDIAWPGHPGETVVEVRTQDAAAVRIATLRLTFSE